ncbi:MAG: hypothetical protein ACTSQP_14260 [Promethearchaeota archaeon]
MTFGLEDTAIYHYIMGKLLKSREKEVPWSFNIVIISPADVNRLSGKNKNVRINSEQLILYLSKSLLVNERMVIEVLEDLNEVF